MDSGQRDEFFNRLSEARKCMELLNRDDRGSGDTKHKHKDGKRCLCERKYEVSSYEAGIPLSLLMGQLPV